jgi:hypothetical protein
MSGRCVHGAPAADRRAATALWPLIGRFGRTFSGLEEILRNPCGSGDGPVLLRARTLTPTDERDRPNVIDRTRSTTATDEATDEATDDDTAAS